MVVAKARAKNKKENDITFFIVEPIYFISLDYKGVEHKKLNGYKFKDRIYRTLESLILDIRECWGMWLDYKELI
jgi:hypothetical protein